MDRMQKQIKAMLSLIMDSSHDMPDYVFHYYVDYKKDIKEKPFYNLIADSFLTLFSFCKLMFENAWSQAFALLRVGLEQVSAVYILTSVDGALHEYISLNELYSEYKNTNGLQAKKVFLKDHNISSKAHDYFDYSWIKPFTKDNKYGRKQMMELAHLEEFIKDIENNLNSFAHGSMSVFQMSGNGWNVMKESGRRASLCCCKLYDFLCCSYYYLVGQQEFNKTPLGSVFACFKMIYETLFREQGWKKD